MNVLKDIFERRELLWNLTVRELKQRYKGSALGFLWSVLTPLFMAVIYVFFLRLLAGRGVPIEEIIIGVFAWQFTTQCVMGGMTCVTGNANLVKKVSFPREILPLSQVAANGIGYLLSLLVQFPLLAFLLYRADGPGFAAAWPLFLFWMLWQTLFNLGLAMFTGAANVYFRDTQHLVGVGLSAWFFMSPVMYNMEFASRPRRPMALGNEPALCQPPDRHHQRLPRRAAARLASRLSARRLGGRCAGASDLPAGRAPVPPPRKEFCGSALI